MANLERLRKLRQRILDHQEQFNYSDWCAAWEPNPDNPNEKCYISATNNVRELSELVSTYGCGTCGCVAGHACMQALEENAIDLTPGRVLYIQDQAQVYLDLTSAEQSFLFMGRPGWSLPLIYNCRLSAIELTTATIRDAIERLDVIINYHDRLAALTR
jgi:hypothetical protein